MRTLQKRDPRHLVKKKTTIELKKCVKLIVHNKHRNKTLDDPLHRKGPLGDVLSLDLNCFGNNSCSRPSRPGITFGRIEKTAICRLHLANRELQTTMVPLRFTYFLKHKILRNHCKFRDFH